MAGRTIVNDDPSLVRGAIERQLGTPGVQVIIMTGGTGISARDSTYEVVAALLHKQLDGFGELFRMLSYEQIGPSAMLSRACAGLVGDRIVVSLPGSEAAVRLAMERLAHSRARTSRARGHEVVSGFSRTPRGLRRT